jgi:hypothetical protein
MKARLQGRPVWVRALQPGSPGVTFPRLIHQRSVAFNALRSGGRGKVGRHVDDLADLGVPRGRSLPGTADRR